MSRIRMVVPPFLVSKLCPFDHFLKKKSCTHHNSVTVIYIFMKLYRNVYQVVTKCLVLVLCVIVFVSESWRFDLHVL